MIRTYNAESKSVQLINYVQKLSMNRRENHIMVPWGCDFTFMNARLNFDQMDKIIAFTNRYNSKNITFMYSTPGQYLEAIK
jgi:lysosomal alpha-mannosidase